jgi:(S)-2-hydroxyglutarate dehydrogenase
VVADVAIVGAGIIGLASARELLHRHPELRVVVVDKEERLAAHQTGHNSGVIHSGVYYAPGSLKARLCVAGSRDLYRYCEERGIPVERCGKVIVATHESELSRLNELYQRGVANGVPGIELIGPERLRELEPHCNGITAVWSPGTGIVDYSAVAESYARDVLDAGGEIRLGHQVLEVAVSNSGVLLVTSQGDINASRLISCGGLFADHLAAMTGGASKPAIVPFRGDYWQLRPQARHLCRNMIYPVPDPTFPFLGIHATRRIGTGEVWLGPNAVLAFAREGYGRFQVRPRELMAALGERGLQRLAARYWRTGLGEMWRDYNKRSFLKAVRRYLPEVKLEDIECGPSGVRAQALNDDGSLVDDFVVEAQGDRVLHVRNAPSPAATSSLAIAGLIADNAEKSFGLGVESRVGA